MDDEGLCVADVGQVGEDLDLVDDLGARVASAFDAEADDPTETAVQILLGVLVVGVRGEAGVVDSADGRMGRQELRNRQRVLVVGLDAQRERLDSLEDLPGVERRNA